MTHPPRILWQGPRVRLVLADPGTSFWLQQALSSALHRDPIDAARDADTLADLLRRRAGQVLDTQEEGV